jgi:hypothetical protein
MRWRIRENMRWSEMDSRLSRHARQDRKLQGARPAPISMVSDTAPASESSVAATIILRQRLKLF